MSESPRPVLFKLFLPILLIFVFVSVLTVVFGNRLNELNINSQLLLYGNLLLLLVTAFSFVLYRKALVAANTQAFLRNVYSGMMLKLFVCIIAAFIYIYNTGGDVNRNGLFALMFLYLLY